MRGRNFLLRLLALVLLWGPVVLLVDCEQRALQSIYWGEPAPLRCWLTHPSAFAPPPPPDPNALTTPAHIVPEWYMLPWYGAMRSVTAHLGAFDPKFLGVIAFYAALFAPFALALVDWRRMPDHAWLAPGAALLLLIAIGALGAQRLGPISQGLLQILVALYFAALWIALPLLARRPRA